MVDISCMIDSVFLSVTKVLQVVSVIGRSGFSEMRDRKQRRSFDLKYEIIGLECVCVLAYEMTCF